MEFSGVGWSCSNAIGQSGEIIILWKKDTIEPIFIFKGEGFIRIQLIRKNNICYVVNVYSACSISLKNIMWRDLLELKKKMIDGEWVLGGDFNSIINAKEKKWSYLSNRSSKMREFKACIGDMNLINLPCMGNLYSWFSWDGKFMSRIDIFLMSNTPIDRWGVVGNTIGK